MKKRFETDAFYQELRRNSPYSFDIKKEVTKSLAQVTETYRKQKAEASFGQKSSSITQREMIIQ